MSNVLAAQSTSFWNILKPWVKTMFVDFSCWKHLEWQLCSAYISKPPWVTGQWFYVLSKGQGIKDKVPLKGHYHCCHGIWKANLKYRNEYSKVFTRLSILFKYNKIFNILDICTWIHKYMDKCTDVCQALGKFNL